MFFGLRLAFEKLDILTATKTGAAVRAAIAGVGLRYHADQGLGLTDVSETLLSLQGVAEWAIWIGVCLLFLLVLPTFLQSSHLLNGKRYGRVGWLMILPVALLPMILLASLIVTVATPLPKLHLLWLTPMAFLVTKALSTMTIPFITKAVIKSAEQMLERAQQEDE